MGGNVPSVKDPNSMMIFLKNQGVCYIIIKATTGAVFQYIDPETTQASPFYRVRLLP
jgi:hypothetical protein